ncbi:FAD-dependent oxidoreductase [Gulosibacter molinativorax]|uniref:FAD-dependent oxidoreductase n=1 Tax=Gulosibacter molinativorax TaxID=256821 RepID=A0ABT7C7J4_9MICO|nr:FAD-dependent oxidoreductase [Gulosibacter molinativorax]MDJ1371211.1 FAD-dependent oxidoreductase [Gulosibacter molinativorax]QUY63026.1 Monomeric sarcosine oxidase [Gulosibacter molinativorax]
MPLSDYIVIGAGLAGAAAAWQLAERGHNVTVVERTTPANDEGSSHGSARIFRYAYPSQLYTDLVVRARSGWDALERAAGKHLITPTGAIDFGAVRQPELLARVLERAGVEHELLAAADARARFPQFNFDTEVLYHPGSGVLDAITTVETMLDLAVATGRVDLRTNWEVAGITRTAFGGFVVKSATGERVAGAKVIVAAGGWFPHLLQDLALPSAFLESFPKLEVRQEQAFHMPWREQDASGNTYPSWPTFIHKRFEFETYGLPGGRDAEFRGQKLAQFNGGPVIPSALDQDGRIRPEMRAKMIAYAEEFLPGVVPEPYAETTCLFTNTQNEDFVIDEADGVVVVSACSGHGGKFAPLLGELAADLATGTGTVPQEFRVAQNQFKDYGTGPFGREAV